MFSGLVLPSQIDPSQIEQIALLVFGAAQGRTTIGGGKILMIADFMNEIRDEIKTWRVNKAVIPEQYQLLRALQFAANYWTDAPRP